MKNGENAKIVREFIRTFWNEGDLNGADRYLADDYVDHAYVPGDANGLLQTARALHAAFPDQRCEEESLVEQGDRIAVRLRMKGTHLGEFRGTPPTRNPIEVMLYREYRLADGKIAEHWALLDTASLLRQIGAELHDQPACRIPRA